MLYVAQATVLSFSFAKIESAKQQNISSQFSICLKRDWENAETTANLVLAIKNNQLRTGYFFCFQTATA